MSTSGIISNKEIPLNKWTLITIQVRNNTDDFVKLQQAPDSIKISTGNTWTAKSLSPPAYPYSIELYINSELDISAQYKTPLQQNGGTLWLFKDPTFSGPKGFVHDIVVWESNLEYHSLLSRFLKGPDEVTVRPVNLVIDDFEMASNTLLPFIKQQFSDIDKSIDFSVDDNAGLLKRNTAQEKEEKLLEFMNKKSKESINNCEDYYTRLDIHAESAELGSVEGLTHWAKLLTFGYEIPESKCGFSLSKEPTIFNKSFDHSYNTNFAQIQDVPIALQDVARGNAAFLIAVEKGFSNGLFALALNLLLGIGLEPIISSRPIDDVKWQLPYKLKDDSVSDGKLRGLFRFHIMHSLKVCNGGEVNADVSGVGIDALCMGSKTLRNHTDLVNGLFYLAALWNDAEAHMLLSYR